ncbi:hypothetical protein V0I11_02690 [Pasteurella multocida]|uniref:hypothetical protein n=1 Tax=Pasteurella multocida TaxID=747 RepID=UPI00287A9A06|nr:hypothetical protein V0I11_02690 [Pasteurella multocida]HDX1086967.1 hypothetical protein [Pasteurella multocida]
MRPFDLERSLAGEPVQLRIGHKAYVKFKLPDGYIISGNEVLNGFYIDRKIIYRTTWYENGRHVHDTLDIVGMWDDEPVLARPLTEPQEGMAYVDIQIGESNYTKDVHDYWMNLEGNKALLKNGRYFASVKEAQKWVDYLKQEK